MGRTGLYVGMAIAALLTGGCGVVVSDSDSSPGGSAPTSTATSSTPPKPRFGAAGPGSATSDSPVFPLVLRRTGGIAGFDDRIVLDANGRLHVETRSVHGRICTLAGPVQRQLVTLLATLRLGLPPTEVPSDDFTPLDPNVAPESDPIAISVTDDHERAIDLSDPSLGEIAGLVGNLVSDVTLSAPAATHCTTPTPPVVAPAP
ncbi:hypothetical protein [Terrabacter terrigena]|uniref:Uncharacterized protein n=1 Tax=Terrabacter terrigena TaxID=574718 RepID=A0ABW3MZW6_9MICO